LVNKFYGEDYGLDDDEDDDGGGAAELPPWRNGASPQQQQQQAMGFLGTGESEGAAGIDADL
jgi:hypothetical protein